MSNQPEHDRHPGYWLDADHPTFVIMDKAHDRWRRQLELIHPCFVELEQAAFRRRQFRREWMSRGLQFDVMTYLKGTFPRPEPKTLEEWLFLLRAWMADQNPSELAAARDKMVAVGAMHLVTFALDRAMLQAIRDVDEHLYRDFSLDLWSAITHRFDFNSRFQSMRGGYGISQAIRNKRVASWDRFLIVWPIQTDPLLQSIWTDVQPRWNDWQKLMHDRKSA